MLWCCCDDDHDGDNEDKNDDDDEDVMKMINRKFNNIFEVDLSGSHPASSLPWSQSEPF